jgi:hypothetical protein
MRNLSAKLKARFLCRAGYDSMVACVAACWLLFASYVARSQELQPLAYNNPGLTVDLGVGLWAWPIPCDADGDGDLDLLVSCPDKPSNGVWYFENKQGDTSIHKRPVFEPAKRLSATVHYVMPSYIGDQVRVLSAGWEYPEFLTKGTDVKIKLPIDPKFHAPQGGQPKGPKVRHNQWRYVDYDGDGALDLSVGIEDWSYYGWDDAYDTNGNWTNGPLHGWIYIFRNAGNDQTPDYEKPFLIEADGKRLDVFGCPSQNFVDFDSDGDLDLLCGEFLDQFTYFENIGTRQQPKYASGQRVTTPEGVPVAMDLEMIVPIAMDWDRDGDVDLIVGDEDGRVAIVENVGLQHGAPQFLQPDYLQQKADTLKCGALATPFPFDWDSDGDLDILCGNTAGTIEFFENVSPRDEKILVWNAPQRLEVDGKPFRVMAGPNGSIQGPAEAKWGYTTLSVADWDHDGLADIVYNSILGRVEWLKNIGQKGAPKLAAPQSIDVEWEGKQPPLAWGWVRPQGKALLTQWRTTPIVFDFNGDGLRDLAMLDQQGYLAYFERTKSGGVLALKAPKRNFVDVDGRPLQLNGGLAGKSGRRKLCAADWDGDGKFDLLLNSSNADLLVQTDKRNGKWVMERVGTLAKKNIEGHDVSPSVADFDGDGIPEFLGGAEDGRLYWMQNPRSLHKD